MSTMIKEICVACDAVIGEISISDAKYSSNATCWSCLDEAEYAEFKAWEWDLAND